MRSTSMTRWIWGLILALCFSTATANEINITPACQQAFVSLKQYIDSQHGLISSVALETSLAADEVRLNCDGSANAYSLSIAQIAKRYLPPPAKPSSPGIDAQTETVLTVLMIIGLIAASSAGYFVFDSGGLTIGIVGGH